MPANGRGFSITFDYRCPFAAQCPRACARRPSREEPTSASSSCRSRSARSTSPRVRLPSGRTRRHATNSSRWQRGSSCATATKTCSPRHTWHCSPARHDHSGDLRDEAVVRAALASAGVDDDEVFAELAAGWPFEVLREEHETAVSRHSVFGVPTFIAGDEAVFVRLMTRPQGDNALARATIDRVLDLLVEHTDLNEFKRTTIPR